MISHNAEAGAATMSRWNKLELIMLFAVPLGGLLLAAWMYFSGVLIPDSRSHQGNLLWPPLSLEQQGWQQDGSTFVADSLKGDWGIVVVSRGSCEQTCQELLYKTRQAHTALGRRAPRFSRYFVSPGVIPTDQRAYLQQQHTGITLLTGAMPAQQAEDDDSVRVFLVDPLGNMMIWYNSEHTGKQMIKDMEKLLKASRIG